jgi:hypothetical protein
MNSLPLFHFFFKVLNPRNRCLSIVPFVLFLQKSFKSRNQKNEKEKNLNKVVAPFPSFEESKEKVLKSKRLRRRRKREGQ